MLQLVAGLWTLALLPLLAANVFLLLFAIDGRLFVSAGFLGAAFAAGTWRLFLATQRPTLERETDEAAAGRFQGGEVHASMHVLFMLDVLFGLGLTCAWSAGMLLEHDGSWFWWIFLLVGAAGLVSTGRAWLGSRGMLLRITRDGIWEPVYGWVSWFDVSEIELESVTLKPWSPTMRRRVYTALRVMVKTSESQFLQRPTRPWTGVPTARLLPARPAVHQPAGMLYLVTGRNVHPETAASAARYWWAVAHGKGVATDPWAESRVSRSEQALGRVNRRMLASTSVVLCCWVLALGASIFGSRW